MHHDDEHVPRRRAALTGLAAIVCAALAAASFSGGGTASAATPSTSGPTSTVGTTSTVAPVTPTRIESVTVAQVAKPAKRLGLVTATTSTTVSTTVSTTPAGKVFFPMNPLPRCYVLDNYADPRSGGSHEGEDILADLGQEVYAVVDGTMGVPTIDGAADSAKSGNAIRLYAPDGSYFFYAHLSAFAPGIANRVAVKQGDVIGFVGDTGNPGPGNYHLHFEIHPKSNKLVSVDPLPLLDVPKACTVY